MLQDAWIITRREVRDSLRDWRIVAPILILTLVFPFIMDLSTRVAIDFVEQYNATIIPLRLVPFAVMIVGFFPISFSLVIALESFVGERERNSLEPLFAAPISDTSLYVGKLLSAMIPPLSASYLGVLSYLVSLYLSIRYLPDAVVLVQILLLTTLEALVMVAGAVVVSSHTTSVRAANLLASFIIIPVAFLLQAESVLLFWGQYEVLWYIMAGLVVVNVILVRMGIQTFNREAILSREIDELNLRGLARTFWRHLRGEGPLSLRQLYLRELPDLIRAQRLPLLLTLLALCAGFAGGWAWAAGHPLPAGFWSGVTRVSPEVFSQLNTQPLGFLPRLEPVSIFVHNLRSLALASLAGLFSFGSLALVLLLAPVGVIGFVAEGLAGAGGNPWLFLAAYILPHGVLELPAAVLATGFALRLGASVMTQGPSGGPVGENLLRAFAELLKVLFGLVAPLLLAAALIEAYLTPRIVLWLYGVK